MEFNCLLEHFGRKGYDVSTSTNLFINSKKQIVIRHRVVTEQGYTWVEATTYKFKLPSTLEDVTNIIHMANSITRCDSCSDVFSTFDHSACPHCTMEKLLETVGNMKVQENECTLCGGRCVKGLIGKSEKVRLSCGHEMCRSCMDGVKKNGQRFYSTDDTMVTTISCPFCRQKENVA